MKKVLVLILSIFTLTIGVNADSNSGICAGKEMTGEGYCKLDTGVVISRTSFDPSYNNLTNGDKAVYYNYHGTINNKLQNLYCIDANLSSPTGSSYNYARPLNPSNSNFDSMIARMYVSLVNSAVYNYNQGKCSNLDDCFKTYLQAANVVMRAIVTRQGYNIIPKSDWGCSTALQSGLEEYRNIYKQLEGLSYSGIALKQEGQYNVVKDWYKTASSTTKYDGSKYKITAELSHDEEIVTEFNGDNFTKIVPVKLGGLDDFREGYDTWKVTNPKVAITGFECTEGLTCTLDTSNSNFNVNDNLIEKFSENEITFYVKVTGNIKQLKNKKKGILTIKIDKYHILDTDNLAILRDYGTQSQGLNETSVLGMRKICYQRMVALMPTTPQRVELEIDLEIPPYCKTDVSDSGDRIYKLGDTEVSIGDYINEGCCTDIDTSKLTDEEMEVFVANCGGEDIVDLKQECGAGSCEGHQGNIPGINIDSYVKQVSMDATMSKVYKWEKAYETDTEEYGKLTKDNLQYWRDDEFASELENNPYCKIYTSEENHMYYPTTTTATSGRFFVFAQGSDGQYLQPYVDGKIYSTFHTAYDLWKKDYQDAITTEKEAFTTWQEAANLQDAIDNAIANKVTTTCDYTHSVQVTCEDGVSTGCTKEITEQIETEYYSGSTQKNYYYGTYIETAIDAEDVEWYSNTDCDAYVAKPEDPQASTKKGLYEAAKNARENLETQKEECQDASKRYVSDWKYILEPDLTFHYNQKYYDSVSGQTKYLTEDITMVISDQEEKYFPNVSTRVTDPTSTSGSWNGVTYDKGEGDEYEGPIYGGGEFKVNDPFENVDETDNENHNYTKDYEGIKLYYRPEKAYYSLVPTGLFKVSEEVLDAQNTIEIGYVFNVQITNYQGEYETWFTIENNGHLEIEPSNSNKNQSNVQYRIDQYLEEHKSDFTDTSNGITTNAFSSKCIYCNREVIYERDCLTCEDDEDFKPQYIYRPINLTDIDPNNRDDSGDLGNNWSNPKGKAAESRINELGAKDSTYDDYTKENLEYRFRLSTSMMQEIKKSNKSTNYYDFNLRCNDYGKECTSAFVTEYATDTSGRGKYKYYVNGQFQIGTMDTISGLNGKYPELEDCPDKLCP